MNITPLLLGEEVLVGEKCSWSEFWAEKLFGFNKELFLIP